MSEIIFGKNTILEALKSKQKFEKIILYKQLKDKEKIIFQIKSIDTGIVIQEQSREEIERISGHNKSGGIVAFIPGFGYSNLQEILSFSDRKNKNPFIIILDGIQDPRNLGSIIRSAEAVGVDGIIIPKRGGAQISGLVINASAGAFFHLKIAKVANISHVIDSLKKRNVWIAGIEQEGNTDYFNADYKVPIALVLGSEGKGLRRLTKEKCDFLVRIPMRGQVTSLNVSSAASVILYEVLKQRDM